MHLQRQRYILFEFKFCQEIPPNFEFNEKVFVRKIWDSLVTLYGESQAYKSGLWMIKFDPEAKWGIIRCNNLTKEQVIAAMMFLKDINKYSLIIHTIKTSGTIKKIIKIQKDFFSNHRNNK